MDQSNSDDFESRLPMDGDRLLIESTWALDSRVVSDPAERFYRLPMGYKRAGDLLVDQAAVNVVDRANVIYPALFCYRQAIELSLKRIAKEFGSSKSDVRKSQHDLCDLWEMFVGVLKDFGLGDFPGLPAAEKLVAEMYAADERSDGFRYPAGKNDVPFRFGDKGIDFENLKMIMGSLENLFESAYMAISSQSDRYL